MADGGESSVQVCIDAEWKRLAVSKERTLYWHQLRALEVLARGQHVLLQAPTGSGKSTPLFLGARVIGSLNKLGFYGRDGFPEDSRVITLIIQPFTALLKSTVKAVIAMGFNAAFIGSEQGKSRSLWNVAKWILCVPSRKPSIPSPGAPSAPCT
jgi:superfamily II DNA helicase RecQ